MFLEEVAVILELFGVKKFVDMSRTLGVVELGLDVWVGADGPFLFDQRNSVFTELQLADSVATGAGSRPENQTT